MDLPSPAIIFWGPDQTQIYNDGYAQIMGPRHPRYFGAPYRECWPDTYPLIYPWMRRVLDHGEVIEVVREPIPVTRYGFEEDAFFTFTFSPLRDDDGRIAGILQPVFEVTDAVLSERRSAVLAELTPDRRRVRRAADVLRVLARATEGVPAAALFLRDAAGGSCRCEDTTGAERWGPQLPPALGAAAEEVCASGEPMRLEQPPAYVLPLPASDGGRCVGAVTLGLNPRLHFDERYREFLHSVARQIAALLQRLTMQRRRTPAGLSARALPAGAGRHRAARRPRARLRAGQPAVPVDRRRPCGRGPPDPRRAARAGAAALSRPARRGLPARHGPRRHRRSRAAGRHARRAEPAPLQLRLPADARRGRADDRHPGLLLRGQRSGARAAPLRGADAAAAAGAPAKGRVPGDAGARAAQPAGADQLGRRTATRRPSGRRGDGRRRRGHRAPGAAHDGAGRRPARRLARHARPGRDRAPAAVDGCGCARRRRTGTPADRRPRPHADAGTARAVATGSGRPQAPGADRRQPADQRRQVHARQRRDPARDVGRRRAGRAERRRRRHRHPGRAAVARLRALRAGAAQQGPRRRRPGHRPGAGEEPDRAARRHGRVRERRQRPGQPLHRAPALHRGGRPAGRARCRRRRLRPRPPHPRRRRQRRRGADAGHAAARQRPRGAGGDATAGSRQPRRGLPAGRRAAGHRPARTRRLRAGDPPARPGDDRAHGAGRDLGLRPGRRPRTRAPRGLRPLPRQAGRLRRAGGAAGAGRRRRDARGLNARRASR
ncbi:sensor protein, frameshifted [Rubrivivax gelatinosus IL144]|uniref:Sensor protein, frameshifted n=1 Tax=Rubrivivax gelatinosus (strain NBRC 100245 / IL144) TaxID=983917 RepID=I0HQW5_RUBGI|nr:sensor protein, frameshifted [Rubrivivax gelatinosus IL144]